MSTNERRYRHLSLDYSEAERLGGLVKAFADTASLTNDIQERGYKGVNRVGVGTNKCHLEHVIGHMRALVMEMVRHGDLDIDTIMAASAVETLRRKRAGFNGDGHNGNGWDILLRESPEATPSLCTISRKTLETLTGYEAVIDNTRIKQRHASGGWSDTNCIPCADDYKKYPVIID